MHELRYPELTTTMRFHAKARWTLLVTTITASALCVGCSKPPATTTSDVIDYVRNVAVGAAVRRLDDAAQEYVERVTAAYGAYKKACEPVTDLASRKALWPLNDAKWRDTEEVTKLREKLEKWLADKPDPEDADAKTRPELLKELSAAITEVPSLPDGNSNTNSRMITEIKRLMDAAGDETQNDEIAHGYLELLTAASDHAADFDPDATGLAFKDAALTARVAAAWQKLHDSVEEPLETELAESKDIIAREKIRREEAIKEKQAIRGQITSDVDKLRRYRELELLVEYCDTRIRDAEHREKKLKKEAAADAAATTGAARP